MLAILFNLGSNRYAIESNVVVEIVPAIPLVSVPHAPEYIAGQFEYRGLIVPVIDLRCLVEGRTCAHLLSTRILLVNYSAGGSDHVLGLLAEKVTEVRRLNELNAVPPAIRVGEAPYLGRMLTEPDLMIQFVSVDELLTPELQDILFARS